MALDHERFEVYQAALESFDLIVAMLAKLAQSHEPSSHRAPGKRERERERNHHLERRTKTISSCFSR
jgi:hypothetical protein